MISQRFKKLSNFNWKYADDPAFHKPNAEIVLFAQQIKFNKQETHILWHNLLSEKETLLSDISPNTLLNEKEEKILFLRYNYARYKTAVILEKAEKKKISSKEMNEAVYWGEIAIDLRESLILANIGLVLKSKALIREKILQISFKKELQHYMKQLTILI